MRRFLGVSLVLVMVFAVTAATGAQAGPLRGGRLLAASAPSAALGEGIDYNVYLPAGYDRGADRRYPVLYLLHGRGDDMSAWTRSKGSLIG